MPDLTVSAAVTSSDPETITRAIETFSRAACGLALDGAEVALVVGPADNETADTETVED